MDKTLKNLRLAFRGLAKRPAFSAVVILTLALGIGANTAVFSALNSVLLRPLPYREPSQLVRVYQEWQSAETGELEFTHGFVTGPDFTDWRDQAEVFESIAAFYNYRELGSDLSGDESAERVIRMRVSSGYFSILGVDPVLGRGFTLEEERDDLALAVISHGLWQRYFGGGRDVLGKAITMDGQAHEILGVMPRGFRGPGAGDVELWTPQDLRPGDYNDRQNHYISVVGRLAPGVSLVQAQERMDVLARAIGDEQEWAADGVWMPRLVPLHEDAVGRVRATLWVLMTAVALVLLSACVNVANLFLVRSVSREKELAVRSALGSGGGDLVAQLLSESMVLAVLGGALGIAIAWVGVRLLPALSPEGLPRVGEIGLDGTVLLFTVAVSVLTGLVFGLAPLFRLRRADLAKSLRDEGRGSTGGRQQQRIRSVLVVSEMAVALVLLIGSGILVRSFQAIQDVDLRVATEGVLTYEVHLPDARYPTGSDRVRFYQEAFPRIAGLPGVEAVGATSWLPVQGRYHSWGVSRLGEGGREGDFVGADMRMVEGDYFRAMGVDLTRGRPLDPRDLADADSVTVINQALAKLLFGEEEAVGRMVLAAGSPRRVVGVAEDTPHDALGALSPKAYIPHPQFADNRNWALIQVVAFRGDPNNIQRAVREELEAMDPNLVLFRPRTMGELLGANLASQRFSLVLMGVFAAMALALAALGIYGVLSYMVSERSHEIGIRMALGAQGPTVRRMVIGRAMAMAGAGIGIGLALALYLSRWLESMVFQVEVADPMVFGAVALGLGVMAWVAAFLPARRATRVDPARAFRSE